MEKPQLSNLNNIQRSNINGITNKRAIWDCNSTLYDSFELNSFQKQLDSAIISTTRTLSMPRHLPSEQQLHHEKKPVIKSKLSRSFQKLLRSVFRTQTRTSNGSMTNISTRSSPGPWFMGHESHQGDENYEHVGHGRCFAVYEKADHGLSTIPEGPEVVSLSPEVGSFVRKTRSERFTAGSVGIYCV